MGSEGLRAACPAGTAPVIRELKRDKLPSEFVFAMPYLRLQGIICSGQANPLEMPLVVRRAIRTFCGEFPLMLFYPCSPHLSFGGFLQKTNDP